MSTRLLTAAIELRRRRAAAADIVDFADFIDVPGRPVSGDDDDLETEAFAPTETHLATHHKLILNEMQACADKDTGRLMIFCPPGSAKSTYATVVFPAHYLGKQPKRRVIVATYGDSLAVKMGRRTRSIVKQRRYVAALDVELSKETSAANNFTLTNGSEYMAGGLLSGMTGNRSDCIIVDDPVRGREDANSETMRNKTWDAYQDDLLTRLIPGGSLTIIQCMAGSTRVLLADGTEKELRDIRKGDVIATYENRKLSTSTVKNWANQGIDCVFAIKTTSGIVSVANERHPFLVERKGIRVWLRLRNLKPGDMIVRVTQNTEHIAALSALSMGAKNLQNAKGNARRITTNPGGQTGFDHRPSILNRIAARTSNTVTESPLTSTTRNSQNKTGDALFVESCRVKTSARIGAENSALITATKLEKCADCCATIAILPLDTGKPRKHCCTPLDTYAITIDTIASITPCGSEDVFDIEVDRTANFIADGLISHNTRWHEDDLSGRILPEGWNGESGDILGTDGNVWRVVCLQAQCENDSDPLGRTRGEYLWTEWFTQNHWNQYRSNARTWGALYQQTPTPLDGDLFRPDRIGTLDALPAGVITWVRGWDLAATEAGGDWTAGVRLGRHADGRFILADITRGQWGPAERDAVLQNTTQADGRKVRASIPQDPAQAGKSQVLALGKLLVGYPVHFSLESGDKEVRAEAAATQVNIGNVFMLRADWNERFKSELRSFPSGKWDDQVDAFSRAFNELLTRNVMKINPDLILKRRAR
jgi:predicted phage terminase large subunit-like protein